MGTIWYRVCITKKRVTLKSFWLWARTYDNLKLSTTLKSELSLAECQWTMHWNVLDGFLPFNNVSQAKRRAAEHDPWNQVQNRYVLNVNVCCFQLANLAWQFMSSERLIGELLCKFSSRQSADSTECNCPFYRKDKKTVGKRFTCVRKLRNQIA